jgi:hypothetical protein
MNTEIKNNKTDKYRTKRIVAYIGLISLIILLFIKIYFDKEKKGPSFEFKDSDIGLNVLENNGTINYNAEIDSIEHAKKLLCNSIKQNSQKQLNFLNNKYPNLGISDNDLLIAERMDGLQKIILLECDQIYLNNDDIVKFLENK